MFGIQLDDKTSNVPYYKLFGAVLHSGSLSGGHYTAICKSSFNGKWYNFNDSHVSSASIGSEYKSPSPYIVFFHKAV